MTLHITNGDSVVELLRAAGIPGEMLPWRDVLHEGPVPPGIDLHELRPIRARFIAARGWAAPEGEAEAEGPFAAVLASFRERDAVLAEARRHGETVLWFEHDLYDQLQLIQLLDFFAGSGAGEPPPRPPALSLVGLGEFLGMQPPERFPELLTRRSAVTGAQLALGRRAWRAFRASDPRHLEILLREDTEALPFLAAALRRHLEQFPSASNGLSRSERQILEALTPGPSTLGALFRSAAEAEEAEFLGDTVFADYLEELASCTRPLLRATNGSPISARRSVLEGRHFWKLEAELTADGRAVLAGEEDFVTLRGTGYDRWLGGVHLRSPGSAQDNVWRWDGKRLAPHGTP